LAVNPGFSNQGQAINLIDKIKNFNNLYSNFNGQLIADGGIKRIDLQDLESNKVDIAVQGGAIFN
jgi:pentose-5-phosphate-3-epimerase